MNNTIQLFEKALSDHGITPPSEIVADGILHRFDPSDSYNGKKTGWYVLHDDGDFAAAAFGDWKNDLSEKWCIKKTDMLQPEQRQQVIDRINKAKQQEAKALRTIQMEVAAECLNIWSAAPAASENNPYLLRKGIKSYGLKEFADTQTLIIPARDKGGILTTLQFIDKDGEKKFKSGGKKQGCYFSFGGKPLTIILICEGYATGASLHKATGYPIAVAFDAGNMEAVGMVLRAKLPDIGLIFCADNDRFRETGNIGIKKAAQAARSVGGRLAIPEFKSDEGKPTDFNDLHKLEGLEVVKAQIDAAMHTAPERTQDGDGWRNPEPLSRSTIAAPYPVDELPLTIKNAVIEVQGFTKAPFALVACSALSNLSLAAQAHYNVQRAEMLTGPIGLYFLVVAESGERKSTCDRVFNKVLRDYESREQEDAKPELKKYEANKSSWEAIKAGIVERIKQNAKGPKPTDGHKEDLRKHLNEEPEPPRVPRLVYSDFTPEALTYSLAKEWPSGGVMSSEGGSVFGSHGMGKESQMRTLSNLNQLWDGSRLTFDRKGGSYVVDGARLTMSLQVQESALMEFFKRTGTLARGTGFLARFLMAQPESTQGTRFFSEPPTNTPALAEYYCQINRILQTPAPINENGSLEPSVLTFTPEAKAAWIKFHDVIEQGLGKGGELQEVRDVASKIADNAARLAALFHIVDGEIGAIGFKHFEQASIIAAWHLNESLRFFGELALPQELANAAKLSDWLISYCKANNVDVVSTRIMSQFAPNQLRDKSRRDSAIQELIDRGHIVLIQSDRKQEIRINPFLLRS